MLQVQLKYLLYGLQAFSLLGCSFFTFNHEMIGEVNTLEGLSKVYAARRYAPSYQSTHLRLQSLRNYAFTVSAQAACVQYIHQIEKLLNQLEKTLDRVYSFQVWMLPHNVLPPVLVQAQQSIHLIDSHTMRIAGHTYQIEENAKLVTHPPHWRYDYLLKDADGIKGNAPKSLVVDLLPRNKKEQQVWKKAVEEGWQAGTAQGHNNFMVNLSRLERALNGMVLYRQLLAKGMITKPYIAYTNLGITGDDRTLYIDDQLLKINTLPRLQHETNKWKPVIAEV